MTDRTAPDGRALDRLSPTEREILLMLAQGHTAKTIAADLGLSVLAVNERLRAARRRTGAGSSRELARWLVRESRDDFSDLAAAGEPSSAQGQPAPMGRRTSRRPLMFAGSALAAVVAIALAPSLVPEAQQLPQDRAAPEADLVARLSGPSPQQLRDRLRAESRDPAWAGAAEAGIRERYGRQPTAARSLAALSVTCGESLCEVIGRTRTGAASDDVSTLLGEIQSGALNASIEQLGLTNLVSSFGSDPANPDGMAFVTYLERAAGA